MRTIVITIPDKAKGEEGLCQVVVDNYIAGMLGKDEALGVVAHSLFADWNSRPPYCATEDEIAQRAVAKHIASIEDAKQPGNTTGVVDAEPAPTRAVTVFFPIDTWITWGQGLQPVDDDVFVDVVVASGETSSNIAQLYSWNMDITSSGRIVRFCIPSRATLEARRKSNG